MKFKILSNTNNRLRIDLKRKLTYKDADTLFYYTQHLPGVNYVRVSDRTGNLTVKFTEGKSDIITALQKFSFEKTEVPEDFLANSSRSLNHRYQDKLFNKVITYFTIKSIVPIPVKTVLTIINAIKYVKEGIRTLARRKLEVPVLDATAISVLILRKRYTTASSVMFLLGVGELLEEWTEKKTTADLANILSLNISKVWVEKSGERSLVDYDAVKENDKVIVTLGNVIPFDGVVLDGEAMVNQASMTGESVPVGKKPGSTVFAGTVLEEGEITFSVKNTGGNSKFEKIVTMIEETEKLKSNVESRAVKLADKLVPYTFLGTGLVYLLTRNITKTLSVLMVDFSCALKLAMPVSFLSAIREAGENGITIKGGKFLEKVAEANTIVFDKTGTLTMAIPTVTSVVAFENQSPNELLRIAACLEEHFPHSMANAVVEAARVKGLKHEEMHTKVHYIVAHGISSTISGKRVVIGSYHFVFEDEKAVIPEGLEDKFNKLPKEMSHLYMAIDGKLSAVICISDPVRKEAKEVIAKLKNLGIEKVVMMTGDNERTAKVVAEEIGVDKYYAGVLPEDKADFIKREKEMGKNVIMVGDGINDSPALSAADCGIAISDGAEIAREIADITISANDLNELVRLKLLANSLFRRIHGNYRKIVGINGSLILLGVLGVIQPTFSALIHNTSTLMIGLNSTTNLLED